MKATFLFFVIICARIASFRFQYSKKYIIHCCNSKKEQQEEQFRIQQEILAQRRNPKAKAELEEKINKRRLEADKKMKTTLWAQNTDPNVDPLESWKKAKAQGLVKDLGYEEITPEMKKSVFGFSLPIVQSPIDLPGYDNGQRFDLRLPYAERGYEDPEADVMGKFFGLFGGNNKKVSKGKKGDTNENKLKGKK